MGEWYLLETDPGARRLPKWMRLAGLRDGEVYLSVALAGDPVSVLLCALADGAPMIQLKGKHCYVAASWLRAQAESEGFRAQLDAIVAHVQASATWAAMQDHAAGEKSASD